MASIPAVLINDTRVDRHHGCTRVVNGIRSLLQGERIEVRATVAAHTDWRENPRARLAMEQAALVVVNGEGTLHHDAEQARVLLEVGQFAAARGTPAVLLNCLWEHNSAQLAGLLSDFALVCARDSRSAAAIRATGCSCHQVPDISLYEAAVDHTVPRQGLGVTDSVDAQASLVLDQFRRRQHALPVSILERGPGAAELARNWLRGRPWSMARHPGSLLPAARARFAWGCSAVGVEHQFLGQLARLATLVSGRFHACALALLTETPFVALPSNTAKIQSLVEDAGLGPWRMLDCETLLAQALPADMGWREAELRSLRDYVLDGRAAMRSLAREIRQLL